MDEKLRQYLIGNNSRQAGRDIYEYYYNPYPIRFFEEDIKEIIRCFADEVEEINGIVEDFNDLYRPDIEKKNEINRLSEEYFNLIKEQSLMYFEKIRRFLKDPDNKNHLQKYLSTITELNNKIMCNRQDFDYFEKVFDAIYSYIVDKCNYELKFDKNLIWVFLHYMYWNCDIGEKYDKDA